MLNSMTSKNRVVRPRKQLEVVSSTTGLITQWNVINNAVGLKVLKSSGYVAKGKNNTGTNTFVLKKKKKSRHRFLRARNLPL